MPMRSSDRILGPARGTSGKVRDWIAAHGPDDSGPMLAAKDYAIEVYRLAPLVGIDPAIVVAQSSHETDNWRSEPWRQWLNPAGLGITYKGQDPGYRWKDGTDAARAQIVHLLAYTVGAEYSTTLPRGTLDYRSLDPRFEAVFGAGWAGTVRTIDDLAGKWAVDPDYAAKIAAKGNVIFPGIADQQAGGEPTVPSTMPTIPVHWSPVPVGAPNNPRGLLLPGNLIIVWHENGNPASDADDEARFLLNGGGPARVSYHFAVDHEQAYQMFALDELCYHAADGCDNPATDRGCFRGVAIEHCQDRDPAKWAATKRNGAILTAMIVTGHPSIHFGGREGDFGADRIETHQAVSDTNKHCPDWMLGEGAIPSQIALVRRFVAMGTTPSDVTTAPPAPSPLVKRTPLPLPIGIKDGAGLYIGDRFYMVVGPRRLRLLRDAQQYAKPDGRSLASETSLKAGKMVTVPLVTCGEDGQLYRVSTNGTFIRGTNFAERKV